MAPDRDDIEGLAGEYVLGTLADDERRAAEARYASDPAFRVAVSEWERRLQPLSDNAAAVSPPAGVLDRVIAQIDRPSAIEQGPNVVALRRDVRRWRWTSAIAGAAAAVLAGIVIFDRVQPVPQSEFVAILTSEGAAPAFVATVNVADGTLSIRRVIDPPPADRSYELWAVEPDTAPVSLGLVDDASLSRVLEQTPTDLTLAISLEPRGGSPTGVATGPIVFVGSLVPTD